MRTATTGTDKNVLPTLIQGRVIGKILSLSEDKDYVHILQVCTKTGNLNNRVYLDTDKYKLRTMVYPTVIQEKTQTFGDAKYTLSKNHRERGWS